MKRILFILFLIPVFSIAQRPIDQPLQQRFMEDVYHTKLSASLPLKLDAAKKVTAAKILIGEADTTVGVGIIGWPRLAKLRDSLAALIGSGGGVSSVSAGYGMNFSTITSTGAVIWDTATHGMTKNTVQIVSATKRWDAQQFFYENTVNGGTLIKGRNDGVSSSGKEWSLGLMGSSANGITAAGNSLYFESTADGGIDISAYGGGAVKFRTGASRVIVGNISGAGWRVGDNTAATARLHLAAGTSTAGTAPLKLTTGTALSSIEDGAFEYHSSHLYFSIGSTRYQLDQQTATGSSGTYSPTITELTNGGGVGFTTVTTCQYMRVGNVVTVSGSATIDPSATSTITTCSLTIPIASNFSAVEQAGGVGYGASTNSSWSFTADATNDLIIITGFPSSAAGNTISFSFTYLVI